MAVSMLFLVVRMLDVEPEGQMTSFSYMLFAPTPQAIFTMQTVSKQAYFC